MGIESNTSLCKCFVDGIEGLHINSNSWQLMKQGRALSHHGDSRGVQAMFYLVFFVSAQYLSHMLIHLSKNKSIWLLDQLTLSFFMPLQRSRIPTHVCAPMLTEHSSAFEGIHNLRLFIASPYLLVSKLSSNEVLTVEELTWRIKKLLHFFFKGIGNVLDLWKCLVFVFNLVLVLFCGLSNKEFLFTLWKINDGILSKMKYQRQLIPVDRIPCCFYQFILLSDRVTHGENWALCIAGWKAQWEGKWVESQLGLFYCLCCWTTLWPLASHSTSLCLGFLLVLIN